MINCDFLSNDIIGLIGERAGDINVRDAFRNRQADEMAKIVGLIASEVRARVSTLPFPENHKLGFDQPSRRLAVASTYLSEVAKAINATGDDRRLLGEVDQDLIGWHAFGAMASVVAGLLSHLEQRGYNP